MDISSSLLIAALCLASGEGHTSPPTPIKPVTDHYRAIAIVDNYRWLEESDAFETKQWVASQNEHTRAVLDALPSRQAILEKKHAMEADQHVSYFGMNSRKKTFFALKNEPPKEQPVLVTLSDPDDLSTERTLVDPNILDAGGGTSIHWYRPSPDGRFVAVVMSANHSERGDVHVFDVVSGKPIGDVVPRVHFATAGGSLVWLPDSSGFLYTRYPRPGERHQADLDFFTRVYLHKLDAKGDSDRYELGNNFSKIAEIQLSAGYGGWLFARITNGDSRRYSFFSRAPSGQWSKFISVDDHVNQVIAIDANTILLLSTKNASRGELLKLRINKGQPINIEQATSFLSQPSTVAIVGIALSRPDSANSNIYLREANGGPEQVEIVSSSGSRLGMLPLPAVSALDEFDFMTDGRVLYCVSRYESPDQCYFDTDPTRPLAISEHSSVSLDDMEVIREVATSKDGTQVPFTILHRKGLALRRDTPTIMTGYGEFNGEQPGFNLNERILLDAGVTMVDTNVRGGSDFGMPWHRDGELMNKQHSFDDFIACALRMIELGYTSPSHLVIEGSSAGGLLVGGAMTQRPDLFKAVVSNGGMYDMLRVELDSNGQFNTTQYGTTRIPAQFSALYAYSPYHHVVDGHSYPDALLLTGATDAHVNPMHSRKMTALLQHATGGQSLVLLRTSASDGHGVNTAYSEEVEQESDMLAFEFFELGVSYPVATSN